MVCVGVVRIDVVGGAARGCRRQKRGTKYVATKGGSPAEAGAAASASPGTALRLPVVNMFWIGDALGVVERLSIRSFQEQGHAVRLHHYGRVQNIPGGTIEADAAETMPFDFAMTLRAKPRGGFAIAADYFRLKLMTQSAGIWSDCDVVCLQPIELDDECQGLFGRVSDSADICNAILYLPQSSPVTNHILRGFTRNRIADWVPWKRRLRLWGRRLTFRSFGPPDYRWATFGPIALTAVAEKYGISHLAAPPEVYYPLPMEKWRAPREPNSTIEQFITERSRTVHLWQSYDDGQAPAKTSAIGRLATQLDAA